MDHGQLQLAHLLESQPGGGGLLRAHVLDIPLLVAVVAPEFAILPGEILVVQVEPVVAGQYPGHHLVVIYHVVGDVGIGEHQRHRIVPGQLVLGRVDGYARGFLQLHRVHVDGGVGNLGEYGRRLPVGNHLGAHAPQAALPVKQVGILHHKTAAAVVEQPRHLHLALQGIIGHAVGFEVVLLCLVHRDEQIVCAGGQCGRQQ